MKRLGSIAAVLILIFSGFSGIAPAGGEEYASVTVSPGGVTWRPLADNGGLTLSVSGPGGKYFRQEFGGGEVPSIGLSDNLGNLLPDGQYSYELVFAPADGFRSRRDGQSEAGAPAGIVSRIQSGTIRISGGQFVVPALEPPAANNMSADGSIAPLDIVQPDDVIVQGMICAGLDCISGEVVGFDTLRLKENNTRITFMDTSGDGFAAADWRLRANDSAAGGAEIFAIDYMGTNYFAGAEAPVTTPFVLSANAPSNSLYIDSSGNLGVGTSTPVQVVHANTGNTPGIRLEQNASAGFAAKTWDIAGNEVNFFIRDGDLRLPFRIRPGAPTSSIDINSIGSVGIGTASPDYRVDVTGRNVSTSQLHFSLNDTDTGGWITSVLDNNFFISSGAAYSAGQWIQKSPDNKSVMAGSGGQGFSIFLQNAAVGAGNPIAPSLKLRVNYDGSITTQTAAMLTAGGVWQNASSREYKDNIQVLSAEKAAEALRMLSPVTYNYKVDPDEKHVGFIAEDVPDLVASGDRKGLSPMDIVAVLARVVQDQDRAIETQRSVFENTIESLKAEISLLRGKVDAMAEGRFTPVQ